MISEGFPLYEAAYSAIFFAGLVIPVFVAEGVRYVVRRGRDGLL